MAEGSSIGGAVVTVGTGDRVQGCEALAKGPHEHHECLQQGGTEEDDCE